MLTRLKQVRGVKVGYWLTGRQKRKRVDWHHRVPDFQLVYCGPKKSSPEEETKKVHRKKTVVVSVKANKKLERPKQTETVQ